MSKIIKADFNSSLITFNSDAWFNATEVAAMFDAEVNNWLVSSESLSYAISLSKHLKLIDANSLILQEFNEINRLDKSKASTRSKILKLVKQTGLVKTKQGSQTNGGGTWLHPKLAIVFARWLSVDFGIWCDEQIENIIHGNQNTIDWNMQRHAVKSTNKVANAILQMVRAEQGKNTEPHHYANEAKLVNWALTGEFKSVDRDSLSAYDLDLLASLENRNSVLLARGVDRETRKESLASMAVQYRQSKLLAA